MTKCVFCGKEEHPFKGVNIISNDGTVSYYCSSKCRRNALNLRRDKRKLKWTEAYRINLAKAKKTAEKTEKKETKEKAEAKKEEKK